MAVKIRLRQQGRNNRTLYRLVVADVRSPRDGRYIEMLGWYNPIESEPEKTFFVKPDRLQYWLDKGAQWTENVKALVARNAPQFTQQQTQKIIAHRAKELSKRKARAAKA